MDKPLIIRGEPSILTRRGFMRTMGLIVGTVAVVPAALVSKKQHDPKKVAFYIGGDPIEPIDFHKDFTADQISAVINKQIENVSVEVGEGGLVTFTSHARGNYEYYEILENNLRNFRGCDVYCRALGETDKSFRKRIKRDLKEEDPK